MLCIKNIFERITKLNNDYFDNDTDYDPEEFNIAETIDLESENVTMTQRPMRRSNGPRRSDIPYEVSTPNFPGRAPGTPNFPGRAPGTPNFPGGGPGTPNFPGGGPGTPGFPGGGPGTPNFPGRAPGTPGFPGGGPGTPGFPGGGPGNPGFPGGGPGNPGFPGGPSEPVNVGGPGMFPPNFSPQLPRGVVIPIQGTPEFNTQFNDVNRVNNMAYQFRYCLYHFTFLWFWNGRTFWFYPTSVSRRAAEGFIWRNQGWFYERINLNHIFFFRCF
jgi:hypothetical protein